MLGVYGLKKIFFVNKLKSSTKLQRLTSDPFHITHSHVSHCWYENIDTAALTYLYVTYENV